MRHYLQITDKKTGKKEEILFYFKEHQVVIMDENYGIHYDSNNYLKNKGDDDNQKEEIQGQDAET